MTHTIMIKNLTKKYNQKLALDHVNLALTTGVYGLLGHNGAGKSTLLNILTTTLKYDSGEIIFDGKNIHQMGESYRDILGYMPQQQSLKLDMNVESFLYYMCSMKEITKQKDVVIPLMKKLNLYRFRKQRVSTLSGGMKQRLLIAQALLNDPIILLLDEPTAGLDPVERMHFRDIIVDIAEDKIILLATHMISDVELIAHEIIMMKKGKVLTVNDQRSLLENTHVYITSASEKELREIDPNVKIVNHQYVNGELVTRFISKKKIGNRVSSTLDDVYLDWLG